MELDTGGWIMWCRLGVGEEGNGVTVETTGRRKHDYRLNDLLQLQVYTVTKVVREINEMIKCGAR